MQVHINLSANEGKEPTILYTIFEGMNEVVVVGYTASLAFKNHYGMFPNWVANAADLGLPPSGLAKSVVNNFLVLLRFDDGSAVRVRQNLASVGAPNLPRRVRRNPAQRLVA